MTFLETAPLLAALGLAAFMASTATDPARTIKGAWIFPAALSAGFFLFSLWAAVNDTLTGFWREHTDSAWGNQVWFDLLLAVGIGWALIAARAKALGMSLFPWMIFILSTGCIGFLAMVSRYLFLKEKSAV